MKMNLFALESDAICKGCNQEDCVCSDTDEMNNESSVLAEQEFSELNEQNMSDLQDTEVLIQTVMAIESLIEAKKKGLKGMALESYSHVANMGVIGTSTDPLLLIDTTLSLEALASRRDSLLGTIGRSISNFTKSFADQLQYAHSFLEFQTGRLEKTFDKLKETDGKKKTVRVKDRKYLHYGISGHGVTSGPEYVKQFKTTSDVLSKTSAGIVLFASEGFFHFFKAMSTIFNSDKRDQLMSEQFKIMAMAHSKLVKSAGLKMERSQIRSDLYASDVLLGLAQIEAGVPKKEFSNLENYAAFTLHVERVSKFERPQFLSSNVYMELTKKDIEDILKNAKELLVTLNDMREEINQYMNSNALAVLFTAGYSTYGELLTKVGRLYLHIGRMIGNNITEIYNVGFGNVKQALTIAEGYTKQ